MAECKLTASPGPFYHHGAWSDPLHAFCMMELFRRVKQYLSSLKLSMPESFILKYQNRPDKQKGSHGDS